ncbi:hypothetical protein FHS15_005034 [Paenibacillus castaneae]|nr:hypothetical protein [Paenibacillus castaneae]NIK79867.1 hypothetical protein [Paenibacillus castaneae]
MISWQMEKFCAVWLVYLLLMYDIKKTLSSINPTMGKEGVPKA